jgi:fibronectin type 3 domain-containing protein
MKIACRVMDEAARPAANSIRPTPAVACRWSDLPERKVAGYRVWRAEMNTGREVVFETRTETSFVDGSVAPGHTYKYAVQAIGADGGVIATSEPVKVSVPGDPPAPGTDPAKTNSAAA